MASGGRRNNLAGKQGTFRRGKVPSVWGYFGQSLLGSLGQTQMPTAGTRERRDTQRAVPVEREGACPPQDTPDRTAPKLFCHREIH